MSSIRKNAILSLLALTAILLAHSTSSYAACDISPLLKKPTSKSLVRKFVAAGDACAATLIEAYAKQENDEAKIAILRVLVQIEQTQEVKSFLEKFIADTSSSSVERFFAKNAAILNSPQDVALQNSFFDEAVSNQEGRYAFDLSYFGDRGFQVAEALSEQMPNLSSEKFDVAFYSLIRLEGADAADLALAQADKIFAKMLQSPVEEWREQAMRIITIAEECKSDSWRNTFSASIINDPRMQIDSPESHQLADLLGVIIYTYEGEMPEDQLVPLSEVYFNAMTSSTEQSNDAFGARRERLLSLYETLRAVQHQGNGKLKVQLETIIKDNIFAVASSDVAEFRQGLAYNINKFDSPEVIVRKLLESPDLKIKTFGLETIRRIPQEFWDSENEDVRAVKSMVLVQVALSRVDPAAEIYRLQLHETHQYLTEKSEKKDLTSIRLGLRSKNKETKLAALWLLIETKPTTPQKVAIICDTLSNSEDKDIRRAALNTISENISSDAPDAQHWVETKAVGSALFSMLRRKDDEDLHNDALSALDFYFSKANLNVQTVLNNFVDDPDEFVKNTARRHLEKLVTGYLDKSYSFLPRSENLGEHTSENPIVLLQVMDDMSKVIAAYMVATFKNGDLNSAENRSQRLSQAIEGNLILIEQLMPYTQSEDAEVKKRATEIVEKIKKIVNAK